MEVGRFARMDLVFQAALTMLIVWTKDGRLVWKKSGACTSRAFKVELGEFEKSILSQEAKGPIEIVIDFTEFRAHAPVAKVNRFRFEVVISHAWQILDIESGAGDYDLFARLFKAAYDSAKETATLDWSDILERKWKISKKEIRRQAEESMKVMEKRRDFEHTLDQATFNLEISYKNHGFAVTE